MYVNNKKTCAAIAVKEGENLFEMINSSHGSKRVSIAHLELSPQTSTKTGYHPTSECVYYILGGRGEFLIDQKHIRVGVGDYIFIQPGSIHKLTNVSEEALNAMIILSPPWNPKTTTVYLENK